MLLVTDSALPSGGFESAGREPVRRHRMSAGSHLPTSNDDRSQEQARLVEVMARGDKSAMAALYDQLSGPLYSLAYRMLGDATEAQDLTQDIFLQLWRTASGYDPRRGSVFSWAVTLTRNRAIDRIRMRRRRTDILSNAAPDLQPVAPASEGDSASALWLREKSDTVRSALAELAPDQRQAIELAFFAGLTQQEIADRLNEPLGTIKARIRRGLLKLKDRLPARL